jgi:NitT/TauT family transport system substrate-binding protein
MNKSAWMRALPAGVVGLLLCAAGLFWPESQYRRPFTVAVNIWPGAEALVEACEDGHAKAVRINFVEMSWSSSSMGAFRKRVVDAAIVTLDEMLRMEADGAKPRAVLLLGISKGSDAILGRPGLNSVKDLRGKRVGVELRSNGEYLLMHALMANGMSSKDVTMVPLNLAETETAYDAGDLDAVVTADPWHIRLREKGATLLYDSSGMGLELSRVLVVREDALESFSVEVQSLVSAHLSHVARTGGLDFGNEMRGVLRRENLDLSQLKETWKRIQIPDAAENLRLMEPGKGGLEQCLERMVLTMQQEGLLKQNVETKKLLAPLFIKEAL